MRSTVLGLVLFLSSDPGFADSQTKGWDDLVSVYYRLEVSNYCGLTNPTVARGFAIARDAILQNNQISDELIDSARAEAWKAGYKEWDNRGLGGFRRWCANAGADYAAYFVEISD